MNESDIAPELDKRAQEVESVKRELRKRGSEPYGKNISGLYQEPFFEGEKQRRDLFGFSGVEVAMRDIADAVTQAKQEKGDNTPFIMVDWGGMNGVTTIKLAKHLEPDVAAKKAFFFVTNLAHTPYIEKTSASSMEIEAPEWTFAQRDSHLVRFVQADATELLKQTITLPDGREIPLRGNIDLIHERRMLEHNPVADTDLLTMGEALSPYGVMILQTTHPYLRSAVIEGRVNQKTVDIIENGKQNLLKAGLRQVADIGGRKLQPEVFVRPQAPIAVIRS